MRNEHWSIDQLTLLQLLKINFSVNVFKLIINMLTENDMSKFGKFKKKMINYELITFTVKISPDILKLQIL